MKVFVDSNIYISLLNKNDTTHKNALVILDELEKEEAELFISNYILSECLTLISQRFGHINAIQFRDDIYKGNTRVLITDKEIEDLSWDIFKNCKDKNISYVDSTNIAFCKKYLLDELISLDKSLINLYKNLS